MTAISTPPLSRRVAARSVTTAWRLRPLVLALACIGGGAWAQMPTGFNPVSGGVAAPIVNGNSMLINQTTDKAIVQWGTFSIGKDNSVTFAQPGAGSIVLNRVTGNELSTIAGSLNANGKVFLINPNGVLFGGGSTVSTGGLVASTLNITNADFNAGNFAFARADGTTAGVTNLGTLSSKGGTIALMGATVSNGGTIVADGGTVGLVSARRVSLDFQGDGLTTFRVDAATQASAASVTNQQAGVLQANGGRVAIIADSSQVAARVVNQQGIVRAQSLSTRNGEILLGAGANDVEIGGTLDASGAAGTGGGTISMTAARATVNGNAVLDARGATGGGTINMATNAGAVLQSGSALLADATAAGKGGAITVDAAVGGVDVAGRLSANAAGDGQGGSITTSGRIVIAQGPAVSASGSGSGANGTWTLQSQTDVVVNDEIQSASPPRVNGYIDPGDLSQINVAPLAATLAKRTDVVLNATGTPLTNLRADSGNVVFTDDANLIKQGGAESTLTVNAKRNIDMYTNASIESNGGPLNVNFNADSGGVALVRRPGADLPVTSAPPALAESGGGIDLVDATIRTNGGSIRFYGQSDPVAGAATAGTAYTGGAPDPATNGINVTGSTLSTCTDLACTAGAGSISLSGRGQTIIPTTGNTIEGTSGVRLAYSTLQTGTGDLSVAGVGGVGASGVRLEHNSDGITEGSTLRSGTGNIAIAGSAQASTTDNQLPADTVQPGLYIENATIATGGDIQIIGRGSDLSTLTNSAGVQKLLDDGSIGPAHGVYIVNSDVTAGTGRNLSIDGTAGSDGYTGPPGAGATTPEAYGVVVATLPLSTGGAVLRPPHTLGAAGGTLQVLARGGSVLMGGFGGQLGVSVDSATGAAGRMRIASNTDGVGLLGDMAVTARGATGGGTVLLTGPGVVALAPTASVSADAVGGTTAANGGQVTVLGTSGVRAHGSLSARGANGGNGGRVETSGGGLDLRGVRVAATSEGGQAGTWVVDPYDILIEHGAVAGSLPTSPFAAVATSRIQDSDINTALNAGTNVTIGTGTGGAATAGRITIDRLVDIQRTTGTAPLTLELDAHRDIIGNDFSIRSLGTAGPLNVVLNSNANNTQAANAQVSLSNATMSTNGGNVSIYGQSDPVAGQASSGSGAGVSLSGGTIDTRRNGAATGGAVTLRGSGRFAAGVELYGSSVSTASGNVTIAGTGNAAGGDGVSINGDSGQDVISNIETTSGTVAITGIGYSDGSSSPTGTSISATTIRTADGTIDVRGRANAAAFSSFGNATGVSMEGASLIVGGTGRVTVAGESAGSGAGILLQGGTQGSTAMIDGGAQAVVLRADNNGSNDAIVVNGPVRSGSTIDLRPGGVDAAGNANDHVATAITLGNATAGGFSLSAADLAQLQATDVVVGSASHAGNIVVGGAVAVAPNLTLQNQGGGSIAVNGGVQAAKVALLAGGAITQAATGPGIVGNALLARSNNGSVTLTGTGNNVATVAGGATGDFRYANAGTVAVGNVAASGFDAATGQTQTVSASGVTGANTVVQARAGNLSTNAAATATNGLTLQADAGSVTTNAAAQANSVVLQAATGVALNQQVQGDSVALLAGTAITQSAAAPITARQLLARSTGGDVQLGNGGNNAQVVAGSAAGVFRYTDADALTVGAASVTGATLAGPSSTSSAAGVGGATTRVQTRSGDLTVSAAATGTNALSLQADTGALALNAGVSGATVALLANGDITQAGSGAGVTAPQLAVRSATGNVALANTANNAGVLAGSAPGNFRYVDANGVSLGTVAATALDSAGNAGPVNLAGLNAGSGTVQALTGNLAVDAASSAAGALTLLADAGSLTTNATVQAATAVLQAATTVTLNQSSQAGTAALVAGGAISQSAAAPITANQLLARSSTGDVVLGNATNNTQVVAGSAGGQFRYTDADAVTIGAVSATGATASGTPLTVTGTGVNAATTRVQARTGALTVAAATSATGALSLQADTGALALNAGVAGGNVTLLANGDITQAGTGAGIVAPQLAVRSTTGNVALTGAGNDAGVLAGSAPGNFRYVDDTALTVATVTGSSLDGTGGTAPVNAVGVSAGDAVIETRTGNLAVNAATTAGTGLTLQADAGSVTTNAAVQASTAVLRAATDVVVNQSLQAGTAALVAGANVSQGSAAPIVAGSLLATAGTGNVALAGTTNDVGTVAGRAGGTFAYTDANAVTLGSVSATTRDAAGASVPVSASGMSSTASTLRTLSGDLTLAANVTGGTADLVAAALFQNPGGASITTTNPWRVWADTWIGESRGGVSGSGTLPNLYNRSYGASVPEAGNHFIYRQQPVATVTLDSASRPAGLGNPALGYQVSGLVLGDSGAGITGAAGTTATAGSPAGTYAVTATTPFVSAEGYAINVVPGLLTINSYTIPVVVDVQRELPTTYTYDRNIAPVAMCFATGPLTADKAEQTGDVLSREWARVRARPNLTNCVSTDRTNACSNF